MQPWATRALARDRRTMPVGFIEPCAPVLHEVAPAGPEWIHEVKHDGFRMIAVKRGRDVRLWSRTMRDWSAHFVRITAALRALPVHTLTIDGEAIAHDERGLPNFNALRSVEGAEHAVLYGFDLLVRAGEDIRLWRCDERREALLEVLGRTSTGVLRFSHDIEGEGRTIFEHACRLGLEGIISKLKSAPYRSGKDPNWRKVKCAGYER